MHGEFLCQKIILSYFLGHDSGYKGKDSVTVSDLNQLKQFLNLDQGVGDFTSDPWIENYHGYELGITQPWIKGRLRSALPFWQNEVRAPEFVLDMIQDGYKIEFLSEPPPFHLKNNNSAEKQKDFVNSAVKEL